jgi:hypothetical protein
MDPTEAPKPKPSNNLRIVLIVLAVIAVAALLGCGLCFGGMYFWVDQNADRLRESGQRVMAEAESFAASHSQDECIDEGLRRKDACGSGMEVICNAEAGIFLRRCLEAAAPTPGLCDGVPPPGEIMAGATWAVGYCAARGRSGDQQCAQFVRAIVEYCGSR